MRGFIRRASLLQCRRAVPASPVPPSSRSGLVRKGRPIVIATLLSRPLGFVREAVQAALFGASRLTDAFLVAYNVPEMIQTLFFSGVLSNFFVPVITRYRDRAAELNRVFSLSLDAAFGIALALAGVCYVAAPAILTVAAPGLGGEDHDLAVFLFRLMLPMLVVHCLLAVIKGTLNSLDHYAMPEYAGVFFNLVMIACALSLTGAYGIRSLAIGVVAGSLVQLVVQIPALARAGIRYRPSFAFRHPALREMGGLVLGAFIATAVVPINAFIARALASTLAEGSISALAYAFRIFLLPVSLFAVPVYTVLLTDLSAAHQADGAEREFKDKASAGLSLLFAVGLPATALVVGLATPITRLLYQRGQFTPEDVVLTSQALVAYGVGIVAYGTSQVMVRLFNATKDTRTPGRGRSGLGRPQRAWRLAADAGLGPLGHCADDLARLGSEHADPVRHFPPSSRAAERSPAGPSVRHPFPAGRSPGRVCVWLESAIGQRTGLADDTATPRAAGRHRHGRERAVPHPGLCVQGRRSVGAVAAGQAQAGAVEGI